MTPYVPEEEPTRTPPSIKDTGTLRPASEWYPQWMQYRRREDNYVFWQDKFMRCSTDIPCECRQRGRRASDGGAEGERRGEAACTEGWTARGGGDASQRSARGLLTAWFGRLGRGG